MPELSLQVTVELSDGWYCIPAKLDVPLLDLINRRRIQTGHKLCTTGAELVGSQDPCTPLEVRPGLCTCLRLYVIYLCDSNSCQQAFLYLFWIFHSENQVLVCNAYFERIFEEKKINILFPCAFAGYSIIISVYCKIVQKNNFASLFIFDVLHETFIHVKEHMITDSKFPHSGPSFPAVEDQC